MTGERLKIIFKWAAFLVIVAFLSQFVSAFLVGIVGGLVLPKPYNEDQLVLLSTIIGMFIVLPFAYFFCYNAVVEYLKGGSNRWQKDVGMSLAFPVVVLAALIGAGIGYLSTGNFNYTAGVLPIVLGIVAGKKAEARFAKK